MAELADFAVVDGAPEAADSEPLPYAQPDTAPAGTGPAGADVAAGSSEAVDADEDDDRNHDTSGAHIRDIALHGAGLRSRRKRGQRGEPDELDGQPARLVLPGRPLKRNEVPTVDTPLLVWSHDPSGEVLVRPVLYACVETQWYGSSLYFLVIPWSERDAPDRSARLVVDATQLRVAPPEMAR